MAKINILTKDIYNRIAAGEVVDRPYSALKELVENSLDAGATEITIYVEKGGKQLIRVCDNGCGIEPDDMRTAFIPHATSKVSCVEDLDRITTLGFRGEALASIASISRTEIVSRTDGNEACKVVCEAGYTGKVVPAALDRGTEVSVYNLFYNTPVRAKFLKTDKAEESDIHSFVNRFVLGNPKVRFKYYADGKLRLESFGNGLEEAIVQVYGAKTIPECFRIDAEKNGIRIHGFIGNQNFFRSSKSGQSLFLNGRYIVNNTIASAINNAYASYLMKRQYPFYVLFVDVPINMVDVNVHPNKADVRFVDPREVYGAVYSVVSGVLDGTAKAADFVVDYARVPEVKSYNPQQTTVKEFVAPSASEDGAEAAVSRREGQTDAPVQSSVRGGEGAAANATPSKPPLIKDDRRPEDYEPFILASSRVPVKEKYNPPKYADRERDYPLYAYYSTDIKSEHELGVGVPRYEEPGPGEFPFRQIERPDHSDEKFRCSEYTYKGDMFNTYLIFEREDDVYIIDQHAAHERVIYERLKKQMADRRVPRQGMLIPYLFRLSPEEYSFMSQNLEAVRSMGFDIEPFGVDAFRVCEVPVDLYDMNFEEFFAELFSDLDGLKAIKVEDILKDKIAMTACKHAVKGGKKLTPREAYELLKDMNCDMGLKCPHGRPAVVKLTKKQIEKMFKRIV